MIDSLLSDENRMFRDTVRKFAEEKIAPNVKAWEKEGKYPDQYYKYLSEMGFLGLLVPEEYGGAGGSMIDLAILCEEMGRVGVSNRSCYQRLRTQAEHGSTTSPERNLIDYFPGFVRGLPIRLPLVLDLQTCIDRQVRNHDR